MSDPKVFPGPHDDGEDPEPDHDEPLPPVEDEEGEWWPEPEDDDNGGVQR